MNSNWKGRRSESKGLPLRRGYRRRGPPPRRKHSVPGSEDEGREEHRGLEENDDAAGRAVEEVGNVGADKARRSADENGDHYEAPEAIGQQVSRRSKA